MELYQRFVSFDVKRASAIDIILSRKTRNSRNEMAARQKLVALGNFMVTA